MEAAGNAISSNVESVSKLAAHVRGELSKVIVGQEATVDQLLLVILCGGHGLVEGVPGLAKTLAVKALALLLQLDFQRVQCTADLMPADVLCANIFNIGASSFTFQRGSGITDFLLVFAFKPTSSRY